MLLRRSDRCVLAILLASSFIAWYSPAWASGTYEFCVTVSGQTGSTTYHAKFPYGDIDPGKEAARVLVALHYRNATVTSVSAADYNPAQCRNAVSEDTFNVTATGDQLKDLGNAVGSGDPAAIALAVGGIAVGVTSTTLTGIGGAVHSVCNWVAGIFGGHC